MENGIDLKELEKFGFEYDDKSEMYYKHCIGTFNKFLISNTEDIDTVKGQIIFYNESSFNTTLDLDTLYDLITAGLVEKC